MERMKRILSLLAGRPRGLPSRRIRSEERRTRSRKEAASGPAPMGRGQGDGRASLDTPRLKRGSLTVESALVLPLFFFGMTALISMMDLYRTETVHLTRLCQNAKVAATYTYNPVGGSFEDIILPDIYQFKPVGGLLFVPKITRAD